MLGDVLWIGDCDLDDEVGGEIDISEIGRGEPDLSCYDVEDALLLFVVVFEIGIFWRLWGEIELHVFQTYY